MTQPNEETQQIRSVQFITIGKQEDIPVPLIRITTCGLLTIEIVDEVIPPQAHYASLTPEQLRGRGTGPALMLLKLRVVVRFCTFRKKVLHFDWQAETPSDVFRKRSVAVIF